MKDKTPASNPNEPDPILLAMSEEDRQREITRREEEKAVLVTAQRSIADAAAARERRLAGAREVDKDGNPVVDRSAEPAPVATPTPASPAPGTTQQVLDAMQAQMTARTEQAERQAAAERERTRRDRAEKSAELARRFEAPLQQARAVLGEIKAMHTAWAGDLSKLAGLTYKSFPSWDAKVQIALVQRIAIPAGEILGSISGRLNHVPRQIAEVEAFVRGGWRGDEDMRGYQEWHLEMNEHLYTLSHINPDGITSLKERLTLLTRALNHIWESGMRSSASPGKAELETVRPLARPAPAGPGDQAKTDFDPFKV